MNPNRVTISMGVLKLKEGTFRKNPKYNPETAHFTGENPQMFCADYIVHFRPEPFLREELQYAVLIPAR